MHKKVSFLESLTSLYYLLSNPLSLLYHSCNTPLSLFYIITPLYHHSFITPVSLLYVEHKQCSIFSMSTFSQVSEKNFDHNCCQNYWRIMQSFPRLLNFSGEEDLQNRQKLFKSQAENKPFTSQRVRVKEWESKNESHTACPSGFCLWSKTCVFYFININHLDRLYVPNSLSKWSNYPNSILEILALSPK